jgi:hypothetical protein
MKRAGEALSVTILCLSAVLAWRLGFSLGASDVEKHLLALISVALEGWKVLLPFVILAAWRDRRWTTLAFALAVWPLLTAYSFVGGLGFSELNRATLAGTRGERVERAAAMKQDLADVTSRMAALTTRRSAAEIEAVMENRRITPVRVGADTRALIEATNGCRTIVSKRTVDLCAEIASLTEEHAQARERVRLDSRLAALRETLGGHAGLDWAGVADPQVSTVAALFGVTPQAARSTLNIIFAALLELIGGLGLFFASLLGATNHDRARSLQPALTPDGDTPQQPETDEARLTRYLAERTHADPGASIVASRLHGDYAIWAHGHGVSPVSLTTFGNLIARQGIAKEKVEGLMRYQGLAINEATAPEAIP